MSSPAKTALLDQAIEAHRRGLWDEAAMHYQDFLKTYTLHADALALYGLALYEIGRPDDAFTYVQQAIEIDPQALLFRMQLASLYQREGQFEKAVSELEYVVTQEPSHAEAWLNLARVAEQAHEFYASMRAAKMAVALSPDNPAAYFVLGIALTRLERHEEAEQAYCKALELKTDWADAWDNLGLTYQFMNRLDEAEAAFRKVIDLSGQTVLDDQVRIIDEKAFGQRHWHLAQLELMRGNYALGFGRYRCRFTSQGGLQRMDWPQPYWKGEDIRGKTILVMDEEGRGDGLMMCRYLPLLRAKGAYVKFYIRPVFSDLFRDWAGADEIITHGEPRGEFDYYTWVMDLPFCFGTTLETVPNAMPYLTLLSSDDHTQLPDEKRPKVGVVWAGSADKNHPHRQLPLNIFAALFDMPGIVFYNLTRDKRDGDDELLAHYPVTDLARRQRHFGDLARFINQMDLIISCDTAAPQLAGGMGKKVWTLLTYSCDWRWLTERDDSPWYPTMKLYRQRRYGDWAEVIGRVKADLKNSFLS